MIFKGRISGIQRDWRTNRPIISLDVLEGDVRALNDLLDKDLTVTLKEFRNRRSLNANAYMWVLLSAIANHKDIHSTDEEIYKEFIQRMCLPVEVDGNPIVITVKSFVDIDKISGYWHFIKESPDGRFKSYFQLRGSSDYNTEEFSRLLDLIIEEAKELGIETLTPSEIERLKTTWQNQ